jgi:putative ABC transport system permease protein
MISPRWRKVVRDLWANKTRTVMVVLAIAVGIFAFASVFITGDVLVADMNTQYQAINASSITLFVRSPDEGPARWALRQPEVVDAQMRDLENVKLVTAKSTFNMSLLVYDDYSNLAVNRITPEQGTWPPGRREILLERTTASHIGANIGDIITIELQDGTRYDLSLAGTVHDLNAVPANLFPELSGYVTMETIAYLGLPAEFSRLEIVARPEYKTVEQLDKVAQELNERLRRAGVDTASNYQVRAPGEHWGRETTQSFTLILSIIGIFSLFLSGFLVVNTMSALMLEQRRQIGMMKAIGGTGRQIIGMYLALVTSYGVMALVVAIPVGLGLAYVFIIAVTGFLNLDILAFHLPVSVLVLQVIAAVVVPAVAAAIPLRGGMKISVREAVSNYGIKVKERQGWLDVLALRVRRLPRALLLSLRNTFRRKGRLLLTLGTLTLAGTLFIGVVNVRASLMKELDNILDSLFNYEVQIYYNDLYPASGAQQRAESVPGVLETSSLTGLQAQRIKPDGTTGSSFGIIGVSPGGDFIQPQIIEGRWLTGEDRNAVVITSRLAKDMPDVHAGDTIVLKTGEKEHRWEVVGIMLMAFDSNGYASFDYVSSLNGSPGTASSLLVRTDQKDSVAQEQVGKAVETRLKDAGIGVAYSMTKDTIASSNASQFDFLVSFLLSMAAMVAVIGGLGLAGMMGLNVMERTREIGVMRSIGASNGTVGGIVITEGLIIGFLSWLLAIPLSIPFSFGFDVILGQAFLDNSLLFVFTGTGPLIWLLIVAIIAVIASLLPARRAVRMSIRETLAYE